MPWRRGGRLTIETANIYLDEAYAATHHEVTPGRYVMIAVSDTGSGMSADAVERAFEPFFTTKEPGKGTGLGLSQVFGFVRQSDGHVKIYSGPGEGTTVKVYLPRYGEAHAVRHEEATLQTVPAATQSEAILVVKDDADVRANSVESLRELGYRVVDASDGKSALQVIEVRRLEVDYCLPMWDCPGGTNGRQLADEARRRRPELNVFVHDRLRAVCHRPPDRPPRPGGRTDRQALHLCGPGAQNPRHDDGRRTRDGFCVKRRRRC